MIHTKLAVGTVQFGMKYGINNKRGKIPKKEVCKIIDIAIKNNIDTFDTTYTYGNAQDILGKYQINHSKKLNLISKVPINQEGSINKIITITQKNFRSKHFYCILIQNPNYYLKYKNDWKYILNLKKAGTVEKIGFSVNDPLEVKNILKSSIKPDIIQLTHNLFDRRYEKYFKPLSINGVEIYTRSVFLQGLLLKDPNKLSRYFSDIKYKLKILNELSKKTKIPVPAICLFFSLTNHYIKKVIIGVDSFKQFQKNIQYSRLKLKYSEFNSILSKLKVNDIKIINPVMWEIQHFNNS